MKPAPFELLRPKSTAEALSLLAERPEDTVILAGGQSLVPLMNMRFVMPERVLDLNDVDDLAYVRREDGQLAVGAMTRHRTVELSDLVAATCPLIARAERHVGYVSVRNRGTVGGSIAHADTVAELACVAVAVGATVVLTSVRGRREIPVTEFLVANMMNGREPDELLAEVRFPVESLGTLSGFAEFARKVGDFPLVTAAAQLGMDSGRCTSARLAVGGVGPAPMRLTECEQHLEGSELTADSLDHAAGLAAELVDPSSTAFLSSEYRRVLTRVVVRDALAEALTHKEAQA